jgi:hypothetical protein
MGQDTHGRGFDCATVHWWLPVGGVMSLDSKNMTRGLWIALVFACNI